MKANGLARCDSVSTRSSLSINLTEINDVVRAFYNAFTLPVLPPAEIPEVAGDSICGSCSQPESQHGDVIVCDSCERGFHVDCAGIRASEAAELDDWTCKECLKKRKKSNQWSFGKKRRNDGSIKQISGNNNHFATNLVENSSQRSFRNSSSAPLIKSIRRSSRFSNKKMDKSDNLVPIKDFTVDIYSTDQQSSEGNFFPCGNLIITKLPPNLFNTAFQVWGFMCHFHELLGFKNPILYSTFEKELLSENSSLLSKTHISIMQVILNELFMRISGKTYVKKSDRDKAVFLNKTVLFNELTWPELAQRFTKLYLLLEGNLNPSKLTSNKRALVLRCLSGDGGVHCKALNGITAMQVDSLLLAEANKKIFGLLSKDREILEIENEECDENLLNEDINPKWALLLEPVQKLPTNVGSRIRNCVHEALENNPPKWAREQLERSISKEVYKGNASGPTKKIVRAVLEENESRNSKVETVNTKKRSKKIINISSIIMKQCRIILREAVNLHEGRFCYDYLRRKINDAKDVMPCPLDFRTIDLKLVSGAYDGSHEAFREDVRQLWLSLKDQPDLVELAERLSRKFESLYEQKVNKVYEELTSYKKLESLSREAMKRVEYYVDPTREIPKAPWELGLCRICGIDKDDNSIILCDICDEEHHIFCLNPPITKIPQGYWYCPACVCYKTRVEDGPTNDIMMNQNQHEEFLGSPLEAARVLSMIQGKDYSEFTLSERTLLLKFLIDVSLDSVQIETHEEKSTNSSQTLVGLDSDERIYWTMVGPDLIPSIIVNDFTLSPFTWFTYESDYEIKRLLRFLKQSSLKEQDLAKSIEQWQKRNNQISENLHEEEEFKIQRSLITEAALKLSEGYFGKEDIRRCECLEPIWIERLHCKKCHKTFLTKVDLKIHNCVISEGCVIKDLEESFKVDDISDLEEGKFDIRLLCVVPELSKRVVSEENEIFKGLKINLLDIEAVSLEGGLLRSSKTQAEIRWAWRNYVKSAQTIYEMVQALIILEDSIKQDFLSEAWFYWSSIASAVQISSLSALSLRIYSLDSAINYEKCLFKKGKLDISPEKSNKRKKVKESEGSSSKQVE